VICARCVSMLKLFSLLAYLAKAFTFIVTTEISFKSIIIVISIAEK